MVIDGTNANRGPWLRRSVALCGVATACCVSAQGIYPGALSTEGYKLPGGFEPVAQLRTYYLGAESLTGSPSAAWALGGWAGLRSPWWGDVFQVGLLGYTSQRLYGPDDKDGTKLLAPGQHPITVLGEAFAAARVFGQTLTGYRQLIDRPYINPQDNRMVPNTFEAYTLTGSANDVSYTGGYITKVKARQSDSFAWMSSAAGGTGDHKGVVYAGATWAFARNAYLRMDEQYGDRRVQHVLRRRRVSDRDRRQDVADVRRAVHRAEDRSVTHRSDRSRPMPRAASRDRPTGRSAAQLYYTQTGTGFNMQNPFGTTPSYLELMQVAFNTAGEKAWGDRRQCQFRRAGRARIHGLRHLRQRPRPHQRAHRRIDSRPQRNQRARRLRVRQGNSAGRTGRHFEIFVAASKRLGADGAAVARLPQLRGSLLTGARDGS